MLLSAQLQKASNPLRVFYQKLFDGQLISMDRSARKAALTLADVSAMPRQTQLLIGHLLQRNESELMLLDDDTDVCALLNAGWLISMPLSPPGFNIFKFKPQCWSQLRSLIPRFLNDALLSELVNYRRHKTAAYPWVW